MTIYILLNLSIFAILNSQYIHVLLLYWSRREEKCVEDKNGQFQTEWENLYFFVSIIFSNIKNCKFKTGDTVKDKNFTKLKNALALVN